jgi:hypothetical protein
VIVARVTNDQGRTFNVRLVSTGERYGLNDCLTHDRDEPLVEFYDATYENDPRFTIGRGQFCSRYDLGTLTGRDSFYGHDHRHGSHGLDLCGHVAEWKLTGANVAEALAAVERALAKITGPGPGSEGKMQS